MKHFNTCTKCGHRVGQGDRHAANACPPPAKPGSNRRARKRGSNKRRRELLAGGDAPVRGAAVPGTGKPRGE